MPYHSFGLSQKLLKNDQGNKQKGNQTVGDDFCNEASKTEANNQNVKISMYLYCLINKF